MIDDPTTPTEPETVEPEAPDEEAETDEELEDEPEPATTDDRTPGDA